ncbi:ferredoxin-thioredoxin reductase [Persephonella atlantica]|uniref:ferredoxin:thioredoxin reductase n=1 Tax=Persephonella atlantica TaxID=2699429 RepID=A0ABS1GEX2_9AQUI|nr:ferredoxin-thioredoxin reductase catalytic domain-containing protein [Persephonella atlantica]MBK3331485.1 ferredoxin-thioredoxin reductase [Persephonella atlantica]
MIKAKPETLEKMKNFAENFSKKSGTVVNPNKEAAEAVISGLAAHVDELGKPLCPCNFYPDKQEEVKKRRWICACNEMQIFKYCHCLLFTTEEGLPITEYLPEWHEGRQIYGLVKDPTPDKGRALSKPDKIYEALKEYVEEHGLDIPDEEIRKFAEETAKKK